MRNVKRKKIAIVGAGFCGLAASWFFAEREEFAVDLYDPSGIGGGASGIAAGLLHPYAGAHNKLNPFALEGIAATKELLSVAERALGKQIAHFSGVLRLATDEAQLSDYQKASAKYPDIMWRTAAENQKAVEGLYPHPGIFIENAAVVDSQLYLEGLFKACTKRGLTLIKEPIADLNRLDTYDSILITAGAGTCRIKGLENLPSSLIKGQVIIGNWPEQHTPLPFPLNSYAYLLMQPDRPHQFCAGATFERTLSDAIPDLPTAIQDILPKVQTFFPSLTEKNIIGCKAGVRVSTPNHLPLIHRHNRNCWVLTGMGSKGLLYNALYAKKVVQDMLRNQEI